MPIGYRFLVLKQRPWGLLLRGLEIFSITTAVLVLLMIFIGTTGFADYFEATSKQWSTAVRIYDFTQVESPWSVNLLFRVERFFYGYFLTHLWTGDDAKTAITLLMVIPWILGFALFVTGFSFRNPQHIFVALWVASIGYTILAIHFLPRYGLAQMPGFMMACFLGYQFFGAKLLSHPRRLEILSAVAIGSIMILYGIKYQPPVNTFEFTPPEGSYYAGAIFTIGILFLLLGNVLYHRQVRQLELYQVGRPALWASVIENYPKFLISSLLLLAIPFAIKGYSLVSIAHATSNPNQQLVLFVRENFDTDRVIPCWDDQTHSYFETLIPSAVPTGYWSIDDLYNAYSAGNILLVTDRCAWHAEIDKTLGLAELGEFTGASPLWAKTPSIRLYGTSLPP